MRGQRPSLDRPSLFAGMEDSTLEDTQRVRILSTLESTRRTSRPHRTKGGRQRRKGQRSLWMQGALWGALGMGVLALMAGFIMVIQESKPAPLQANVTTPSQTAAPATTPAKPDIRVATLDAPASAPAGLTPQGPAVIETTASAEPAIVASPHNAATASTASVAAPTTPPPQTSALAAPAPPMAAPTRKPEDTPARAQTAVAAASKPAKSRSAKGQDDDVALLEAMFAHTGRKAPVPAHKN